MLSDKGVMIRSGVHPECLGLALPWLIFSGSLVMFSDLLTASHICLSQSIVHCMFFVYKLLPSDACVTFVSLFKLLCGFVQGQRYPLQPKQTLWFGSP